MLLTDDLLNALRRIARGGAQKDDPQLAELVSMGYVKWAKDDDPVLPGEEPFALSHAGWAYLNGFEHASGIALRSPLFSALEIGEILRSPFPSVAGVQLAQALLDRGMTPITEIDLTSCKPGLLTSSFFNSFLQHIADNSEFLEAARWIRWRLEFDFQRNNVATWASEFKPHV